MLEKDIINTWLCYKISNGEREELKNESNTSEMTFREDGRLTYKFMGEDVERHDALERNWKIEYRNDLPALLINGEDTDHSISLADGILILESIKGDGFRHYYADRATFPTKNKPV